MPYNIFVLGLEDRGREALAGLPDAHQYVFHPLLTLQEMQHGMVSLPELLRHTRQRLDAFTGRIDAIVGYWDFPVCMLVPILSANYGLPSKDLASVVKCEHKYWSRLIQQTVIDAVPAFGLLEISDVAPRLPEHMSYPVWVKPIESFSSEGASYVEDDPALLQALAQARERGPRLGTAFDAVLDLVELPEHIVDIPGSAYMVEEAVTGKQCTVEGYSCGDHIQIIGTVDSLHYENSYSFLRYQYPSLLPQHVLDTMADLTRRVIDAMGLKQSTFNVEYFWDETTDRITLLEINSRHSQSHTKLFQWVDGMPNHLAMVDLALGREPQMPHRQGEYAMAAKWMLRRSRDGIVHRVPTAEEIQTIEHSCPNVTIDVVAQEGSQLSAADGQDSYSYVLAEICTAGTDEAQLQQLYQQCCDTLHFDIQDLNNDNSTF